MKVYIGCFKKKSNVEEKGYYSIQLGAAKAKEKICKKQDDKGANISLKNPLYCEQTGLYWIWKNTKDKIIGLVHYRRFFYERILVFNKKRVVTETKVNELLKKHDLILPSEGMLFSKTVREQYISVHDEEDLKVCGEIIREMFPDYYETYNNVLNANHYHPFNMFIGKKEIINKYCEWLFPILEEVEKRIDVNTKGDNDKRFCGFLSERLFNVYIIKNKINYTTLPVYNTEQSLLKQVGVEIIKKIIHFFKK